MQSGVLNTNKTADFTLKYLAVYRQKYDELQALVMVGFILIHTLSAELEIIKCPNNFFHRYAVALYFIELEMKMLTLARMQS